MSEAAEAGKKEGRISRKEDFLLLTRFLHSHPRRVRQSANPPPPEIYLIEYKILDSKSKGRQTDWSYIARGVYLPNKKLAGLILLSSNITIYSSTRLVSFSWTRIGTREETQFTVFFCFLKQKIGKRRRELLAAVANQYRCQPTSSVRLDIDGLLFRPESIESLQQ